MHWHVAETDGVLLDVLCAGLSERSTETHLVDPVRAKISAEVCCARRS